MNKIVSHLKNHKGDMYIVFLMIGICALLVFSMIFSLAKTRTALEQVYIEIENSTDIVIAHIKKDSYDTLMLGSTDGSRIDTIDSAEVAQLLAAQLGAEVIAHGDIRKMENASQDVKYEISNIVVDYKSDDIDIGLNEDGEQAAADSGTLTVSFDITIPIRINGQNLGNAERSYEKTATLNFK